MKQSRSTPPNTAPTARAPRRCWTAAGSRIEEINLARDPDGRAELSKITGMNTFPQIVIDGEPLGGFNELLAADRAGTLRGLLAA